MKKKIVCLIALVAFAVSFAVAYAAVKLPIGTYQCAICGVIEKVPSSSTVLDETDIFGDGHRHDWRYIGGISGTIHPIK